MSARHVTWHWRPRAPERKPPNKRLKLTGGDRFNGIGVLCPWRGTDSSHTLAPASESPAA